MSWLKNLMGMDSTIKATGDALDQLFTSDEERAQAQIVLEKIKQAPAAMQAQMNLTEASHRSVFVAGWRPAIGWVCALSLAAFFIPQFLLGSVAWMVAIDRSGWSMLPPYPVSASGLMELVTALLGMAAFRTYEKKQGLSK